MKIKEAIETLNTVLQDGKNVVLKNLVQTSSVTKHATIMLDEIKGITDIELKYETATLIMQHLETIRADVVTAIEEYKKTNPDAEPEAPVTADDGDTKEVAEPVAGETAVTDTLTAVTDTPTENK